MSVYVDEVAQPDVTATLPDDKKRIPGVYLGIAGAYLLLRLVAIAGLSAQGGYPDSAGYRQGVDQPTYRFVSLTGHAMRPWVPPLLFANLPSDAARVGAQFIISIVAWLVLATTVALALRSRALRVAAFSVVLALSCTPVVTNWDRFIGSESTAISFAVLALAAWIRFAKKPTPLNSLAVVASMIFWSFTKAGTFPIVGLAAAIVVLTLIRPNARQLKAIVAVSLVVLTMWAFVANARSDATYEAFQGQGLSQFNLNFQLELQYNVLKSPSETAWFVAHGMPDPGVSNPNGSAIADYLLRPDVIAWGNDSANGVYTEYVATHAGAIVPRFAGVLPSLLVPPAQEALYSSPPRSVIPGAGTLLFDTTSAPVTNRPWVSQLGDVGLLLAAIVVLLCIPRRRKRDAVLLATAVAISFLTVLAMFLGWVVSPIELVRHAMPASLVFRLALWLVVFALLDALVRDPPARKCKTV